MVFSAQDETCYTATEASAFSPRSCSWSLLRLTQPETHAHARAHAHIN